MSDKFFVNVEDLINFVFPATLQHPIAAARLFAYGMCGPLVDGLLTSGPKGSHKISVWELDAMCLQMEREDIIRVYLHTNQSFGCLTSLEQEAIINQADSKLKVAKGRAMLPQITKKDVYDLLKELTRGGNGTVSFHDVQHAIEQFREDRIKRYKLVYPELATKVGKISLSDTLYGFKEDDSFRGKYSNKNRKHLSIGTCNPETFKKDAGLTDPDVLAETSKLLGKHAFKICSFETSNDPSLTGNVRLLRDVGTCCPNPFLKSGKQKIKEWDNTAALTGTNVGSLVQATPSSTTWIRKVTL